MDNKTFADLIVEIYNSQKNIIKNQENIMNTMSNIESRITTLENNKIILNNLNEDSLKQEEILNDISMNLTSLKNKSDEHTEQLDCLQDDLNEGFHDLSSVCNDGVSVDNSEIISVINNKFKTQNDDNLNIRKVIHTIDKVSDTIEDMSESLEKVLEISQERKNIGIRAKNRSIRMGAGFPFIPETSSNTSGFGGIAGLGGGIGDILNSGNH